MRAAYELIVELPPVFTDELIAREHKSERPLALVAKQTRRRIAGDEQLRAFDAAVAARDRNDDDIARVCGDRQWIGVETAGARGE